MNKPGFIVITNAVPPYQMHNISILSLPSGGRYHFRYRRPFVSASLPQDIKGCPGLLVVRNRVTGEMLPMRWCTAVHKEDYGEYLFFDFQVELIFDARSLRENEVWSTHRAGIEAVLPNGVKNEPNKDLSPLVFPVPLETLSAFRASATEPSKLTTVTDHVQRWLTIVSLLGKLDA